MRVLKKGQESAHHLFFHLLRSVLCESATLALYRIVTQRSDADSDDGQDRATYRIGQNEVDGAYTVAESVGQRWLGKLRQAGEEDLAISFDVKIGVSG